MSFFDSFDRSGDENQIGSPFDPEAEMLTPPEGWIGGSVAVDDEVGRSSEAAVFLVRLSAYPEGFSFTTKSVLGTPRRGPGSGGSSSASMGGVHTPLGADRPPRVGVEFSDGRRAAVIGAGADEEELGYDEWVPNYSPHRLDGQADPAKQISMEAEGGGGTEAEFEQDYWVWGRPPDGSVTFIVDWEEFGLPESRLEIGGGRILEASLRSKDARQ